MNRPFPPHPPAPNGRSSSGSSHDAEPADDGDVRAFLEQWPTPVSDPAARVRLLARLAAVELAPRLQQRMSLRWAWLILRAQLRLVHAVTWFASLLVLSLGTVVTLAAYSTSLSALPLVLVSPLVAALGVAFLYGLEADPALEVQLATPVSPRLILLARLALLFGFNLMLSLFGSILLSIVHAEISLWPLVLSWLAPMTFLSSLAFLLSVLFFDPLMSAFISLSAWVVIVWRHFSTLNVGLLTGPLDALPDLLSADAYPLLFIIAFALVGVALWLSEREERWTAWDA